MDLVKLKGIYQSMSVHAAYTSPCRLYVASDCARILILFDFSFASR